MTAKQFFAQTTGELIDTLQRWSVAIDDAGNSVDDSATAEIDSFVIDMADNGILRFPDGSTWETTSDALLRLGAGQIMPGARKKTVEALDKVLNDARPLAFLAEFFG